MDNIPYWLLAPLCIFGQVLIIWALALVVSGIGHVFEWLSKVFPAS